MKNIIKKLLPPIILDIKRKMFFQFISTMSSDSFTKWWANYSQTPPLNNERCIADQYPKLVSMISDFIKTESFKNTSGYWRYLSKCHIELLCTYGIDNFKQTIGKKHYAGEVNVDSKFLKPIIGDKINIQIDTNQIFKKHSFCTLKESIEYNLGIILLLNYVNKKYSKYLEIIEESIFGNPINLSYKGRSISFELLNSIFEIDFVMKYIEFPKNSTVLEIGAGSGRMCIAMLNVSNSVKKYIIVDIPPALYISQCNITNYFSGKNIFEYRPFSSFLEIKEKFDSADIVFITPEQLQLIPENSVHLSIAIDCLHEMKFDTVELFFSHFDRISKFLYFKCQISQWAKTSKINLNMDSYPVKSHWGELSKEKCYIPNSYFHAIYCMRSNHLKQHDNLIKEEVLN